MTSDSTRDGKRQTIWRKCFDANPDKQWYTRICHVCNEVVDAGCDDCECEGSATIIPSPATLADVLLAIEQTVKVILIDETGHFLTHEKHDRHVRHKEDWRLRQDSLDQQSDDTIDFLHSLLCE